MTGLVEQSCLVAKDAAFNLRDFLENSSNMASIAVKDCEKELDRMERTIDERITSAITEVTEPEARELLACLKFIIDLERIGDLTWSITMRLQHLSSRLQKDDRRDLIAMAEVLEKMLENVYQGFVKRKVGIRQLGDEDRHPDRPRLPRRVPPPSAKQRPQFRLQHQSCS